MKLKFSDNARGLSQPDPYIIKAHDGNYYIYATGVDGVLVYRSSALDGIWEYLGIGLKEEDCHEFWAPCVVYEDGLYYMYYSSCRAGCEDMHDHVKALFYRRACCKERRGLLHFLFDKRL